MWPLRHKVVPIHMDSVAGLEWLKSQRIQPDIIYIDGDHHYKAVVRDLEACSRLFPDAILVGDDYGNYNDVSQAVSECAARHMKSGTGLQSYRIVSRTALHYPAPHLFYA
jgi:hypothetical protein